MHGGEASSSDIAALTSGCEQARYLIQGMGADSANGERAAAQVPQNLAARRMTGAPSRCVDPA